MGVSIYSINKWPLRAICLKSTILKSRNFGYDFGYDFLSVAQLFLSFTQTGWTILIIWRMSRENSKKSWCHAKRRMSAATRAYPSFVMTTTKTLRSVLSWRTSFGLLRMVHLRWSSILCKQMLYLNFVLSQLYEPKRCSSNLAVKIYIMRHLL